MRTQAKRRVVVLHSVRWLRDDLTDLLKFEGYHVAAEGAADNGLARVRVFRPHIIVAEYRLLAANVFALLRSLRALREGERFTIIVLLPPFDGWRDASEVIAAGADATLQVPFTARTLLEQIATAARHSPTVLVVCPGEVGADIAAALTDCTVQHAPDTAAALDLLDSEIAPDLVICAATLPPADFARIQRELDLFAPPVVPQIVLGTPPDGVATTDDPIVLPLPFAMGDLLDRVDHLLADSDDGYA